MKNLCCLFLFLLLQTICFCQYTDTFYNEKESKKVKALKLEPLLGYTFSNRGGWANITPELFLGFDTMVYKSCNGIYDYRLRFGPTLSTASNELDTNRKFRALMMPGPASIALSLSASANCLDKRLKVMAMAGSTVKFVGYSDHSQSITQNNLSAGGGVELPGLFILTAEHTWAWHNVTDESELAFKQLFGTENTSVRYLTLTVEGYSQAMDMFIFCSWRKFLNDYDFSPEIRNDTRVISIGIRKDIDLLSYVPAGEIK